MDPIQPVGPREREIPPVTRVVRRDSERELEQERERRRRERERERRQPPADGEPHIDVKA